MTLELHFGMPISHHAICPARKGDKMSEKIPADGKKHLTIRFPFKLYLQLKERAEKNHRSFNSEVVYILKDALKSEKETSNG